MVGGGAAVLALANPWSVVDSAHRNIVEFRSIFLASAILVALFVLAYFTNPGETSFRAYLTEQSFRQHLSRLDDVDSSEPDHNQNRYDALDAALRRDLLRARAAVVPPVHFASRAAVSLRTPRHILHSCGVLTLGAVLPDDDTRKAGLSGSSRSPAKPDPALIQAELLLDGPHAVGDAWYIGAFGRWWRGGVLDSWWLDAVAHASGGAEDDTSTAGILRMSTLDKRESTLPFSVPSAFGLGIRGRSGITDNTRKNETTKPNQAPTININNNRDSTPPPLPKSASLPLHTSPEHRNAAAKSSLIPAATNTSNKATLETPTKPPPSRTPSQTSLAVANSQTEPLPPVLADLARQLSISKASTLELRNQLAEVDSSAARAKSALETELAEHRAHKKSEDAARAELRSKTKALEDSKRSTEAGRREVEKKLRAAKAQRDSAAERRQKLQKEIRAFEARGKEDKEVIKQEEKDTVKVEKESAEEVERKKKEVKVAEDVVAALNARAKELEESLEKEKARLAQVKEEAELKRQDAVFFPMHAATDESFEIQESLQQAQQQPLHHVVMENLWTEAEAFNPDSITHARRATDPQHIGSNNTSHTNSPAKAFTKPRRLSLIGISNFEPSVSSNASGPIDMHPSATRFAPFGGDDADESHASQPPTTGRGSFSSGSDIDIDNEGLLSSSLVRSLALDTPSSIVSIPTPMSAAASQLVFTRSDEDPILPMPKQKRKSLGAILPSQLDQWPTHPRPYLHGAGAVGQEDEDVFTVRAPPMDAQRVTLHRTRSDPMRALAAINGHPQALQVPTEAEKTYSAPRRWFSVSNRSDKDKDTKDKDKINKDKDGNRKEGSIGSIGSTGSLPSRRGLNPDAKAFTLSSNSSLSRLSMEGVDPTAAYGISVPHLAGGGFGFGGPAFGGHSSSAFDMLNPSMPSLSSSLTTVPSLDTSSITGLTTSSSSPTTSIAPGSNGSWSSWDRLLTPSFSMRAFAPSKAERVALQRALGSNSVGGSLERLPSLSAVGSLPGSPEQQRRVASSSAATSTEVEGGLGQGKAARTWFSLPKLSMGRKPKFSPFDEDEAEERAAAVATEAL